MKIKVTIKQLGKKRNKINTIDFELNNTPKTVNDLICESVKTCINTYNTKTDIKPLSNTEIDDMSEIGKIAFGINYGKKMPNEEDSIRVAKEAFSDGIVRIFMNNEELTKLDQDINVKEGDLFTFIKLAMLAGSMF